LGLGLICIYLFTDRDKDAVGFGFVSLFIGIGLFLSRYWGVKRELMMMKERFAADDSATNRIVESTAAVTPDVAPQDDKIKNRELC